MAVLRGDQFMLRVQLGDASYVVVNDINTFSIGSDRDVGRFPVFQRANPHTTRGARDRSFDVGGFFSPGDAGQDRLRAMEAADTPVNVEVLWDGTNGFRQEVNVSSYTYDADPEGLQEYGFTLTPTSAASTVVGAGPSL